MSMTNPMGITANAMVNYPRGTMGLSVNGYTDAGISHTMNNEDLWAPTFRALPSSKSPCLFGVMRSLTR